jgi:secondary thiamine-phosphate synthase enzyme
LAGALDMSEATRTKTKGTLDQVFETLHVDTRGTGLSLVTEEVRGWLAEIGALDGLLTLFIRHTSASLLIQENADPDVQTDLIHALDRLAPKGAPYLHTIEGDDDMPAHVKAALTATSLSIPVRAAAMVLGTWQGIYVAEHRDHPHTREVLPHYLGTRAAD